MNNIDNDKLDSSLKNKNIFVVVFELIVIVLGIGGITFATSRLINSSSSTLITASKYNIDFKGDRDINVVDLEPISDSLINIDTEDNVIRLEFSLKGVSSNKNEDSLIYDIMVSEMNIDCPFLNKYTKWNLYKNGELLSNGSLDPMFDSDVLSDTMTLTNTQESLPKHDDEYDNYVLLLWISESCDNIETCELVDQSNIIDSTLSMKVFVALSSGKKIVNERIPSYDNSCANKPELYDNMIPVNYVDGNFVVANDTNSDKDNLWYDYNNQKWANAVVVNKKKKYDVGSVIPDEDINGYFVWIPRYRYKTWNVEESVTDSYNAYDEGIEIVFENGLNSIDNDGTKNDEYITHPVFSDNLKGFWISKYELSRSEDDSYKFIRSVNSYRDDTIDNYKNIGSMISSNYSLGDNVDSHMINNLEWGATLYLSHSKYGVCNGDGCSSISKNLGYVSGNDKQDTTTRNVYGVYDMAGASGEYVLGDSKLGSATNEVFLQNGATWYDAVSILNNNEYLVRGGLDRGLFYFGNIGMTLVENSTRVVLTSK